MNEVREHQLSVKGSGCTAHNPPRVIRSLARGNRAEPVSVAATSPYAPPSTINRHVFNQFAYQALRVLK
jgi:hypothetical protein